MSVGIGPFRYVFVVAVVTLSSMLVTTTPVGQPDAASAFVARGTSTSHADALARSLYFQAIARMLMQKRFEVNDILHFGVRSQAETYRWHLQAVVPDRFREERNDRPPFVLVHVGNAECYGPSPWFCRRSTFQGLASTLQSWLLPQPALSHLAFGARQTPAAVIITIHAHGDPWQCVPETTCPGPGVDDKPFQARSRYTATLVIDRPSGLPGSLTSTVTMGLYGEHFPPSAQLDYTSPAQRIHFSYGTAFNVSLPRYRHVKCGGPPERAVWCMKEPGA